jgi:hypothetical protein
VELYLHSHNTPLWRGAQLRKAQGQFHFYLTLIGHPVSHSDLECPESCGITIYRLSAIAYGTYSQLSSISGVCLLHPQPEDAPCHDDRDPLNTVGNRNVKMTWTEFSRLRVRFGGNASELENLGFFMILDFVG